MMASKVEPELAKRLEALTGADAACCVDDFRAEANEVLASKRFDRALVRAKALCDEKRLLALALIKRRGEMCGCELQAALDVSHATVSHHMRALVEADLVTAQKRGKWVHYAIHPDARPIVP